MAEHNELGKQGEALALQHLQKEGYEVLEQNWVHGKEEVDIIARKGDWLVMVEVKARMTNAFGEPEAFVNRTKQRHLVSAANAYVEKEGIELETRFDIISVLFKGGTHQINHIEDAFYPTL
ncbi:MAG: YraN family protein [Flavobacteriales bacterium]|nr:YraN family protein [Flavobacteriales bacterium]MCB9449717.1 YraN family protein [Flavobacteriales bacterium]